ncbi:unnamed protein product [Peniophora sp. CBMAI 1063]|nr:unnamed protein product [Peniophora sp. CBMAI 1063]
METKVKKVTLPDPCCPRRVLDAIDLFANIFVQEPGTESSFKYRTKAIGKPQRKKVEYNNIPTDCSDLEIQDKADYYRDVAETKTNPIKLKFEKYQLAAAEQQLPTIRRILHLTNNGYLYVEMCFSEGGLYPPRPTEPTVGKNVPESDYDRSVAVAMTAVRNCLQDNVEEEGLAVALAEFQNNPPWGLHIGKAVLERAAQHDNKFCSIARTLEPPYPTCTLGSKTLT